MRWFLVIGIGVSKEKKFRIKSAGCFDKQNLPLSAI
jgi:hypothetical protein